MTTTTGLTLRFLRDDDHDPRVLYICDRLGTCPVCGHELIERIYSDTSYHHFTVARFRQLAAEAAIGFAHPCEQCGEALDEDAVRRSTITYGFPQEPGLIQAFTERDGDVPSTIYALSPHRELDGQMQPEWQVPDDQSVAVFASLTEDEVLTVMGRFLSVKAGWRRLLRLYREHGSTSAAALAMAPGYWGLVGPDRATVLARLEELRHERGNEADAWVTSQMSDPINHLLDHGPADWLPDDWLLDLERGAFCAVAAGELEWAESALEEALKRLPVRASCAVSATWDVEVGFPVGRPEPYVVHVSLAALLLEALVLGAAPSDWLGLWLDDRLVEVTSEGA